MIAPEPAGTTATTLGLLLWISSTYWYKKQRFIRDKNMFNLVMFGFASFFSSLAISRFFFESAESTAIKRNNYYEIKH